MVDPNNIRIFDRSLLNQKRARTLPHSSEFSFLRNWAEKELKGRLADVKRNFSAQEIAVMDAEEILGFEEGSCDLITSVLDLHTINDLPGALIQIRRSLKPDGLFIGAMFGGETLYELRESLTQAELEIKGGASPRVHPFASKQDLGALLQRAGFALPVVDSEILTVTYADMFRLMHDLRGMGETNILALRNKSYPGKGLFLQAAQYYQHKFSEPDGRIYASFEILFLLGWAPHASQQQPLKPGSAQNRLADALKTSETKV